MSDRYLSKRPYVLRRAKPVARLNRLKNPVSTQGNGYLAGSFPSGLTTVDGVPVVATVRVLLRPAGGSPGDGLVVAEVQSAPDGTWIVENLNTDLVFDVVGRKHGFNDVIWAGVSPVPDTTPPSLSASGSFFEDWNNNKLMGRCGITGGTPPFSVAVHSGSAPSGITFRVDGRNITAVGTMGATLGVFNWTLRITDSLGQTADLPCTCKQIWRPSALGSALNIWLVADHANNTYTPTFELDTWTDLSGNGLDFTPHAASTTYRAAMLDNDGRLPRRRMAGSNAVNYMHYRSAFTAARAIANNSPGLSCIMVTKILDPVNFGVINLRLSSNSGYTGRFEMGRTTGTGNSRMGGRRLDADAFVGVTEGSTPSTQPIIHYGELNWASAIARSIVDSGTPAVLNPFQTAGNSQANNSLEVTIGYNYQTTGPQYNAIGELLLFNRVLTDAERQKVEGYLAWMWRLVYRLPSNHPYKSAPPLA